MNLFVERNVTPACNTCAGATALQVINWLHFGIANWKTKKNSQSAVRCSHRLK